MKPETLTEAIGMIDDDLIVNARHARPVRRKRFLLPGIAAAAAVVCLTVGASAAIGRNSHLLTRFFGDKGESAVAEAALPEPVVYENDKMRLTVETEIDDGVRHLILLSGTTLDGEPFDWHPSGAFTKLVRADGSAVQSAMGGSGFGWNENRLTAEDYVNDYPKYFAYFIPDCDLEGEQCWLTFTMYDETRADENPAAGIRIPVNTKQNTPLVQFTNGSDTEYALSGFELISTGAVPWGEDPDSDMLDENTRILILRDGTRIALNQKAGSGYYLSDETGHQSGMYRTYLTEFDWVDVSQVAAVEIDGKVYERVTGE
ncbi:MAG: hypothetical protein IJ060_11255 [Oscillospiraceae bacterium]|nr:hypothetical protein [Oscillospiraceae bacterium]